MTDLYADSDKPGVALIADAPDQTAFAAAITAAGGRVVAPIDWAAAATASIGSATVIVADAVHAGEADLLATLPRIAAAASACDAAVVVVLTAAQIDPVAAVLFGPEVTLLCDPDAATLAGAIALAIARRHDLIGDTLREGEAERLRRLSDEVARIAQVLARLTTHADRRVDGGIGDRSLAYAPPPGQPVTVTAADIRRAIRARRLRDAEFPGLFEDPAWDMLLDLYAADLEGAQVSVSSLCIAAAVPPTTALRWIARMTEAGLFERRPDPFDRRRAFMTLTGPARERMDRHFAALAAQGLTIV